MGKRKRAVQKTPEPEVPEEKMPREEETEQVEPEEAEETYDSAGDENGYEDEEEDIDDDNDDDDDDDDENDENDEEEDGDLDEEDDEDNDNESSTKPKKNTAASKKSKDFVSPTAEEMINLRQSKELFASNLVRMQIHELLGEVCVNYQACSFIEPLLHQLKKELSSMGEEIIQASTIEELQHFKLTIPEKRQAIHFQPPTSFNLVGSYLVRTIAKPTVNIDVSFMIPTEVFSKKDIPHLRYFERRLIYLAHICQKLKQSLQWQIKWGTLRNDSRKPVLFLKPPQPKGENKFIIRLIPTIPKLQTFIERLHPKKGNIHPNESESNRLPPSPYYNNSILEDMFYHDHLVFCHDNLKGNPNLVDASILFKVWLRQREMSSSHDTFNGFLMTMLMLHLREKKLVNEQMSSYQIFRIAMEFLSTTDISKGIFMKLEDGNELDEEVQKIFLESFDVVFVDKSGILNMASHVSLTAFQELQNEARLTQEYFKGASGDNFETIFLTPVRNYLKYDMFFRVEFETFDSFSDDEYVSQQCRNIVKLLQKGLTDRLIGLRLLPADSHQVSVLKTDNIRRRTAVFGLLLDPQNYQRIIDMGPPAESPEAADFRKFWGQKAELRRFKDGSIMECVVWDGSGTQKHQIMMHIIQHILVLHANVSATSLKFTIGQLQFALKTNDDTIEPTRLIIGTFDKLTGLIKDLPDLPLKIQNINPASSCLRYTDPSPPQPIPTLKGLKPTVQTMPGCEYPALIPPIKGIIIFESSGKWPDELLAVQAMLSAFYIQLQESLKRENIASVVAQNFIDIFYEGHCFRFHIYLDREARLLAKKGTELPNLIRTEDIIKPKLYASIHALQSKNTNYGPTVRLAKKWIHSQLYSAFFSDEVVELLVAYIFAHPQPYSIPNTPLAGFHRFLWFLSTFDFENNALYVPFDEEKPEAAARKAQKSFETIKNSQKTTALFIATKFNPNLVLWTKNRPTKQVFRKLVESASDASKTISESIASASFLKNYKVLFEARVESFDLAILLDSKKISAGKSHESGKKLKASSQVEGPAQILVGFDPVSNFVDELRVRFQDIALIFYNKLGGERVCFVWKPSAFLPRPFKPNTATNTLPLSNPTAGQEVIINIFQIISDIHSIGGELVSEIKFAGGDHIVSQVFDNGE